MKKSTSRHKPAGPSAAREQQKDARPERYNRARPARSNNPEPDGPGNSTIHNGSANAFDATEEARDDEDSDEDNDDFAREND
jgi:hypothetical protein